MNRTTALPAPTDIDPALYREVLGHYPTGVAVMTACDDDEPIGMVVGTFTAVSLDPPLVAFLPTTTSGSYSAAARRHGLLRQHSRPRPAGPVPPPARPPATTSSPASTGARRASARPSSRTSSPRRLHAQQEIEAGDHYIVLCRVQRLEVTRPVAPLLFFQGGYGGFSPPA